MEKITYVVHAFQRGQRGRKQKEGHFTTLEEAHAHAAYLGATFDCVVLATQRKTPPEPPKGRQQGGFLASFMRLSAQD